MKNYIAPEMVTISIDTKDIMNTSPVDLSDLVEKAGSSWVNVYEELSGFGDNGGY